ncbi:unnamed protein product, partial [Rotaria socialis]
CFNIFDTEAAKSLQVAQCIGYLWLVLN